MEQIIGTIDKSKKVKLVIRTIQWQGKDYVDIRDFFKPETSEEWVPTRRGISFRISRIKELLKVLHKFDESKAIPDQVISNKTYTF